MKEEKKNEKRIKCVRCAGNEKQCGDRRRRITTNMRQKGDEKRSTRESVSKRVVAHSHSHSTQRIDTYILYVVVRRPSSLSTFVVRTSRNTQNIHDAWECMECRWTKEKNGSCTITGGRTRVGIIVVRSFPRVVNTMRSGIKGGRATLAESLWVQLSYSKQHLRKRTAHTHAAQQETKILFVRFIFVQFLLFGLSVLVDFRSLFIFFFRFYIFGPSTTFDNILVNDRKVHRIKKELFKIKKE